MLLIFRPWMLGRIKYHSKADDGDSITGKKELGLSTSDPVRAYAVRPFSWSSSR